MPHTTNKNRQSAETYANRPCLGWRPARGDGVLGPYEFITYREAFARSEQAGSAFLELGCAPHDRVGVFGVNCPEWMVAMQGCNRTRWG